MLFPLRQAPVLGKPCSDRSVNFSGQRPVVFVSKFSHGFFDGVWEPHHHRATLAIFFGFFGGRRGVFWRNHGDSLGVIWVLYTYYFIRRLLWNPPDFGQVSKIPKNF